jgi:LysM repeat protein
MIDIGLPMESYDAVFGGVKTKSDMKFEKNTKLENIAKQNGMTVEEFLNFTAQNRGMTIEQVKQKLGMTE